MITQEQITSVLRHLPSEFSIGELVDILIVMEKGDKQASPRSPIFSHWKVEPPTIAPASATATPSKPQLSPAVAALRGIAKLLPEDANKSYDELRWEAMRTKYEL